MLTHELPTTGDKITLSDSVKKIIQDNVENGKHQSLFKHRETWLQGSLVIVSAKIARNLCLGSQLYDILCQT